MSWHPSNDPVLGDPTSCDALDLVIVPRTRDLGDGFEVRRALPHGERQMKAVLVNLAFDEWKRHAMVRGHHDERVVEFTGRLHDFERLADLRVGPLLEPGQHRVGRAARGGERGVDRRLLVGAARRRAVRGVRRQPTGVVSLRQLRTGRL